ncbi:MAG: ADP-ribosylglycohydrolase family protein [Planctomycetia bacterium]|nr:ADP-ribosylglycohydrolase family protein [Planctomycetia bacterium]
MVPDKKKEIRDRMKGLFWGLVVGDCLGSPIQFTTKDGHATITDMVPCKTFHTPAGHWTDDSSLAFCIADSYVRLERYDLRDIAMNFVRWYKEGFWSSMPYAFDIGGATETAIDAISRTGQLKNGEEASQGNGSLMRLAPSFLMNYGAGDNALVHEISDLTHNSTVVRAIVDQMVQVLTEHIEGHRTVLRSKYTARESVNNSGWVVSTFHAALWALEQSTGFEQGMLLAVNLGGDADTIGAVYGQIAGALYGYEAIPERWLGAIKDRDRIDLLIEQVLSLVW